MTLLETAAPISKAARAAAENFAGNLAALRGTQPLLAARLREVDFNGEWVFGRDGFLSWRDESGKWLGGCSLPLAAARIMLRNLKQDGVAGCLLLPTHAAQVMAALERVQSLQAIMVVQPDEWQVAMMLCCGDFAEEIRRHRVWFVTGEKWVAEFEQLFENWPGLATPTQFIRIPGTSDDAINPMIQTAQGVFARVAEERGRRVGRLFESGGLLDQKNAPSPYPSPRVQGEGIRTATKILLVAPTHFRMWDDAGYALQTTLGADADVVHLDPDDPAQASALNLAIAANEAAATVIPNRARSELPIPLPAEKAVLSWVTQPRIWAFDSKFSRDGLLLADESWMPMARKMGWPADRVAVANWPLVSLPPAEENAPLALIADTNTLEVPTTELNFSSHHVMWEMIRQEILTRPFALGVDIQGYLDAKRRKLGIGEDGFDRELFVGRLILAAYVQAVARRVLDAGMQLRIYGNGWNEIAEFEKFVCGPIDSREKLIGAVARASGLVYPWPIRFGHAIDAMSRGVMTLSEGKKTGGNESKFTVAERSPLTLPSPRVQGEGRKSARGDLIPFGIETIRRLLKSA